MLSRSANFVFYGFLALAIPTGYCNPDPIIGYDPETRVYRLRIDKPGETLQDDDAAMVASSLEELIMAHDYEREFLMSKTDDSFEEKVQVVPYYAIPQNDHCVENNGNCSQICETVGYERVCSCDEGYSLTSATACSPISECNTVLSGTSGEFTIKYGDCQWLIKAPKDHIIEIKLPATSGYNGHHYPNYYYGEIYDGDCDEATSIMGIPPSTEETVFKSSGQNLLIKSGHGWDQYSFTQDVSYVTGFKYFQMKADETVGYLTVPASALSPSEHCLSLTYSTPTNVSLKMSLNLEDEVMLEVLTPQFSFKHPDGKWQRDIFRIPPHQGGRELTFEFSGEGTRVYNLGRCLNLEYHAIGGQKSLGSAGSSEECRNGGVWSSETESCSCPQGFSGIHCEEGCGRNKYGVNCSKRCSFLSSACEGMIFCTKELCSCAPGLQGRNCDSLCDPGSYGASCRQQCGKCKDDEPCDRYTGICYSGCATGFYQPFCKQTYKVLMNAPHIVAVTYNSVKIRISFRDIAGEGEPILYQVQYKEEKQNVWSKLSPRSIPNETEMTEFEIMGLFAGKVYETRVILIDKDGGSHQTDVPKTKARTKCIEPIQGDYKFLGKDVDETSVLLEWSYEHDKTSLICEIVEFELSVCSGSEHLIFLIMEKQGSKKLSNILPDLRYSFQLIGKTVTGKRTLPVEFTVQTLPAVPGRVRAVKTMPSISGRQLEVTWQPPQGTKSESLRYKVTYQCIYLLACESISCDKSSGDIDVSTTSVVIDHLQPHALYQIEIASVSPGGIASRRYVINATTAHTAPHVKPSPAENPVPAATNTTVLLSWMPPEDCSALNGYIYGYSYSLVGNNTGGIIQQGTVPENVLSVNFTDLAPSHCYDAYITVVSSGGTSLSDLLHIPFCTSSTAPDRVQSLSVYKRGRRMVGLRWSPPLNTYGDIESFTITYSIEGSAHKKKLTTEPKFCGAWRDLYCYTVPGLSPGKKYHFEVQARNKEVNVDGEPTAVEAITLEGASTPPVNPRIINATETSLLVEWGMPDNINGQLRSFIIIVEQIDTQASHECCDDIPLQDYRVTSEEPFYRYEITDLAAASTYSVTISAKTVTLGEESRIIGHTYPPKAILPQNALMVLKTDTSSDESDVVTLQMHAAERISGVNRTYILLYLTSDTSAQQPFQDNELATLLQSRLAENYHLISEYTQEEVENQSVVTFHLKELGFVSTEIQSEKYALVLIQDYMGNRSMDIFITEETDI